MHPRWKHDSFFCTTKHFFALHENCICNYLVQSYVCLWWMHSIQVALFFSGLCSEKKIQESRTSNKTGHVFSQVREMFLIKVIGFNNWNCFDSLLIILLQFHCQLDWCIILLKTILPLFAGSTLDVITQNMLTL